MTESASANKIRLWSDSAAGNNSSDINGSGINWVEGQNPSTVNNSAREVLAQVRQWYYPDQAGWADWGATASIASQTVFKLAGDQTGMATAGRRLRLRGGSVAARYASILSASYTAETTITIVDADGSLSNSMSVVGLATTSAQTAPRRVDKLDVSATLSVGTLLVGSLPAITVLGSATFSGTAVFSTVAAINVANVGTLSVSAAVTIGGQLTVAGSSTFSGTAIFKTGIHVSATASVGFIRAGGADILLNADFNTATFNSETLFNGTATFVGKTTVEGAFTASGNARFLTNIDVSATASVGQLNVGSVITIAGGPTIRSGTGAPESAVTASKGSLFMRTDGAAGSTLYYKSTGTGNTGWTAVA